jgi:hypothetical protein
VRSIHRVTVGGRGSFFWRARVVFAAGARERFDSNGAVTPWLVGSSTPWAGLPIEAHRCLVTECCVPDDAGGD